MIEASTAPAPAEENLSPGQRRRDRAGKNPGESPPQWQRRTNVWRGIASPAQGSARPRNEDPTGSATQCREPAARLLRALVLLRLTASARKFEEIVAELMKDCLT